MSLLSDVVKVSKDIDCKIKDYPYSVKVGVEKAHYSGLPILTIKSQAFNVEALDAFITDLLELRTFMTKKD